MAEFFGKLKKRITGSKRQMITAVAAVFVVYVLLVSGIFSYFQSKDNVTNRLSSVKGSVTLLEPLWDSKGQYMASASEPGMNIPKNPYGLNDGQADLYIRLKMTISLDGFEDEGKTTSYMENFGFSTLSTEVEQTAAQNKRRLESIAEALRMSNETTHFITLKTTEGESQLEVSNWEIDICNNKKFYYTAKNQSGTDNKLVFYFYYTGTSTAPTDNTLLAIVKPNATTAELFNSLKIPIYKSEYLGVFDQGYSITLEAEAIPAANYESGLAAADAKAEFDNNI